MDESAVKNMLLEQWGVSRETVDKLSWFTKRVIEENARQNLISPKTETSIWHRHILDSMQLLSHASTQGHWVDLGSGAGFPGLVLGIARPGQQITLIETRRMRIAFLQSVVDALGLKNVSVQGCDIARANVVDADIITARAFAPLPKLFSQAAHLASAKTVWVLPKGISAKAEVVAAQEIWHGVFHVKQSLTNPEAGIVIATEVKPKK